MRVLLLNDNPVVNKLVTLSAQKTGHELINAESIGAVEPGVYDLLIVEEGLYDSALIEELGSFISFSHSILIAARNTAVDDLFDKILYKPFLPTELLLMLHQTAAAVEEGLLGDEAISLDAVSAEIGGGVREYEPDEANAGIRYMDDEEEADDIEQLMGTERFGPVEKRVQFGEEAMPEHVLKEEDVRAVRDLLEDVETGEAFEEIPVQNPDDVIERAAALSAIEEEINEALMELSDEEMMAPADEDLLLDIVNDEVQDEAASDDEKASDSFMDDALLFDHTDIVKEEAASDKPDRGKTGSIEGVEALRALLDALQNRELAKSLKGSITINISFGENQ